MMKIGRAVATAAILLSLVAALIPTVAERAAAETVRPKGCPARELVTPGVERIGGADRYEVAVHASEIAFPEGSEVAYIASGTAFPDALSGSAAAGAQHAPVLLVPKDSVPASVMQELVRLSPKTIILLGGTESLSTSLEQSVAFLPSAVKRIGGADRYEVSAELALQTFHAASETLYIASGEGFPDALSASAAAGNARGPVLLVTKDAVPDAILQELNQERFLRDIVVVGGPASISDAVILQLAEFARITRIVGPDRFAVSAAASANEFCDYRSTAFIASGTVFPDALAGSAAAIAFGGPVLLVNRDSVPLAAAAELRRMKLTQIKVLGGPNTISDAVVAEVAQYLQP